MDVLIADLDEDGAALGQKVPGDGQTVPKVRQVRVDPELPCVAESLDLLDLTRASSSLPSFTSRLRADTCQLLPNRSRMGGRRRSSGPCHERFPLGEARHHIERIA